MQGGQPQRTTGLPWAGTLDWPFHKGRLAELEAKLDRAPGNQELSESRTGKRSPLSWCGCGILLACANQTITPRRAAPRGYSPECDVRHCAGRDREDSAATRWRRPSACTIFPPVCVQRPVTPQPGPEPLRRLFRLRVNLALEVRRPCGAKYVPSTLWQSRCGGGLKVSALHDDFPALLAEALDVLAASTPTRSAPLQG